MPVPDLTVCVLLYGPHTDLAYRCLESLRPLWQQSSVRCELRLGLNTVTAETRQVISEALRPSKSMKVPPDTLTVEPEANIGKYPLMRQMFCAQGQPILSPHVMWFDDDSFLELQEGHAAAWLQQIQNHLATSVQLGAVYTQAFVGQQAQWVQDQPWYTGKTPFGRKMRFVTGGWWAARVDDLRRCDYPWPTLYHNGGDHMLGELWHQQGLAIKHFRDHVRINANEHGVESKAARRGISTKPIGYDYRRDDAQLGDTLNRATPSPAPSPLPASRQRKPFIDLDV